MDHNANIGGRTPFTDVSNTTHGAAMDAKERKRQREKARYAAMTIEQRNERNKKRREMNHRNRVDARLPLSSKDETALLDKENVNPKNDNVWLQMEDSYQTHQNENNDMSTHLQGEPTPGDANNDNAIAFTDISPGHNPVPQDTDSFRQPDMQHGMELRLGLSKGPICPSFN